MWCWDGVAIWPIKAGEAGEAASTRSAVTSKCPACEGAINRPDGAERAVLLEELRYLALFVLVLPWTCTIACGAGSS